MQKMMPLTEREALIVYLQQQRKKRKAGDTEQMLTPFITQEPQDQSAAAGSTPTFNVAAFVGSGTVTYQWQSNTGAGFVDMPAQTSASLTLPAVSLLNNGNLFRARVTANGRYVFSRGAVLTVTV